MAELNLTELREVAEAATPGPWEVRTIEGHEEHAVVSGFNTVAFSANEDATHIATFDPPTVLALLDRVTELEAVVGRVQELMDDAEQRPTDWNGLLSTRKVRQAIDGRDPIEILREKLTGGDGGE